MKFVSNLGNNRVIDLAKPWLKTDHQLDILSPAFSLFAFAELADGLADISQIRLILPYLSDEKIHQLFGVLGTQADRANRNKLQVHWLAKNLSAWLESKAHLKHTIGPIPQSTLVFRDSAGAPQQSILGSFSFSSEGLGIAPGNPLTAWRTEQNTVGDTTAVFRDSAFENDVAKSNFAAILEQNGVKKVRSL